MDNIKQLKHIANEVRINCIKMITQAKAGHPGSSLSSVDLLTVLFFYQIKRTIHNALNPNRDRFILSKGHAVPVLYSIFSQIGLIKKVELDTFRKLESRLQGHPDVVRLPFLEASTGSLGQGLSIAQGMAIFQKMEKMNNSSVYCLIGDGEIQEGQIWEALMSAPKMKLNNLCVLLDYNKLQIDGSISDVMPIEPLREKIESFNWNVMEIDGHNFKEIIQAYDMFKNSPKPFFIIAHTIKGKGVHFMENNADWHGKAPNLEESKLALKILKNKKDEY